MKNGKTNVYSNVRHLHSRQVSASKSPREQLRRSPATSSCHPLSVSEFYWCHSTILQTPTETYIVKNQRSPHNVCTFHIKRVRQCTVVTACITTATLATDQIPNRLQNCCPGEQHLPLSNSTGSSMPDLGGPAHTPPSL